jgi:hypothetical protein
MVDITLWKNYRDLPSRLKKTFEQNKLDSTFREYLDANDIDEKKLKTLQLNQIIIALVNSKSGYSPDTMKKAISIYLDFDLIYITTITGNFE